MIIKSIKYILLLLVWQNVLSQSVTIDPSSSNSKILDVKSSNKGLMPPKMTTTQRKAIANPEIGLLVFDTNKGGLYMYDGQNWLRLKTSDPDKLDYTIKTPNEEQAGSNFGSSVAIDGDWAIIGASHEDIANNPNQGAVYVFKKINNAWQQKFKIIASDGQSDDVFGISVSISNSNILIGSRSSNVYVYKITGFVFMGTYIETVIFQQKITPPILNNILNNSFGDKVAINNDKLVITDYSATVNNIGNNGVAYYYRLINNAWVFQSTIYSSVNELNLFFGISLSFNGDYIAIGAQNQDNPNTSTPNTGAVSVYVFGGGTITLQSIIYGDNSFGSFGRSVALYGETLLVSAPDFDMGKGIVYLYRRTNSTWNRSSTTFSFDPTDNAPRYGWALAMSADYFVITTRIGTASFYKRNSNTNTWSFIDRLQQESIIGKNSFGTAVAVSATDAIITNNEYGKVFFVNLE